MATQPEQTTVQAPTKVCPSCGAQAQTLDNRCPHCNKKYKKRRGGIVLKVMLGLVLGTVLLIAGCSALLAGGVNEAQKQQDAKGITAEQFSSIKQGTSQSDVEAELGTPENAQEFEQQIPELQDQPSKSSCIYYPESGKPLFEGRSFQLCFDGGKLTSKNAY
jgi:hypothetical protein